MKKSIITILIIVILSALTVGIVLAQSDGPTRPDAPSEPFYHGWMMGGRHHNSGYMAEYMHAAFAETLGISVADLETRIAAGESMYDIALSLGFNAEEIADLHEQARQNAFELAYADGFIDEEHYEWMLERMNGFGEFGMYGGGYGMHGGGYGHGGGGCHGYYQEAPSE